MYGMPKLGWVRQWVGDHLQALMIAGAVLVVGYGVYASVRGPRTRVVAVTGGPADGATTGTTDAVPPAPTGPAGPADAAASTRPDPVERELALRERELDLRERELAFARRQAEALGLDGVLAAEVDSTSLLGAQLSATGPAAARARTDVATQRSL